MFHFSDLSIRSDGTNPIAAASKESTHGIWEIVYGTLTMETAAKCQMLFKQDGGACLNYILDQWTPLHYICENKDITQFPQVLQTVLKARPDNVNALDENGLTPLHLLCRNKGGDLAVPLKYMIDAGADVNKRTINDKKTPLHFLCDNEFVNPQALQALLAKVSDSNQLDEDESNALHYFCLNEAISEAMVDSLLKRGVNPNHQNKFRATSLHQLCLSSQITPGLLRIVLSYKADPNVPDNIGSTPFHYLCENTKLNVQMLEMMINEGKGNILLANSSCARPIDLILRGDKKDCIEFVKRLLPHESKRDATAESAVTGGEDTTFLDGALKSAMESWNNSLPPFDNRFYTKVCCDPSFEKQYTQVQELSGKYDDEPDNLNLKKEWEQSLARWRTNILCVYVALIDPSIWSSQEAAFQRKVPADIMTKKATILSIWKQYPKEEQRVSRLQEVSKLF